MTVEPRYRMSINLNVLNHLGINLYSNMPAVLSEVVANAWDADAEHVDIRITTDTIYIRDNGTGMSLKDINEKYLNVGYSKRIKEPGLTKKGRAPMGRKGIGKLSVFSIADEIRVYTSKDGERNALMMSGDEIKAKIKGNDLDEYTPSPLDPSPIDFDHGTLIILKRLKKGVATTATHLRKRLARRFSVIGPANKFSVTINGEEITVKDRDYYRYIEFLWHFGDGSEEFETRCRPASSSSDAVARTSFESGFKVSNVVDAEKNYFVRGWIGTVDERKNIDDTNNTIVVYAHGKLIQEDMLKDFAEGGIYTKYIIGEIDADFMDLDEEDDIVTSDRQRVKEDDPRYEALKVYVRSILKVIESKWTDLRTDTGAKKALEEPVIKAWYDKLKGDNKKYARRLFGKIESLRVPDPTARKEMYKASILAFEKLALTNNLSILENLETEADFKMLAEIFASIDELEAVHYYQIVKGRIEVIKQFERILDVDSKERIIQQHIFDHLWLLHPSWERAASDPRIEQSVIREFNDIDAKLTSEERDGRIDIRYKTAAGKHIIIELKKYRRKVTVYELLAQVSKYRSGLEKCLRTKFPDETRVIESICILGSPPEPIEDDERNIRILREAGARYITYDTLVSQTLAHYTEYLQKEKDVSDIIRLVEEIDTTFG